MDHERAEKIKNLKIEMNLLLNATKQVDNYIDKLSLEQDQIKLCLQDAVNSGKLENPSTPKSEILHTPVQNKPVSKAMYAVVNDEEENIEAINSQPLTLDLDLDEFIVSPKEKPKLENTD